MNITIEKMDEDGLKRKVWNFWMRDEPGGTSLPIYLDSFSIQSRASKRHKWQIERKYNRLGMRDIPIHQRIGLFNLVIPDDIKAEAKSKIFSMLEVKLWPGRDR